jgi:pyruvate dehydrogenase E2 component (dihydrolipoamide acetyltransferase)
LAVISRNGRASRAASRRKWNAIRTSCSLQTQTNPIAAPAVARPSAPLNPLQEVVTPDRNYGPARLASGVAATPYARRLAFDRKIDIAEVKGSGADSRIVGRDVAAFKRANAVAAQVKAQYDANLYTEIAFGGMRATIARRWAESKRTIPHFQLTMDVEIDRLRALRESINAELQSRSQHLARKVSLNDLLIEGWAAALSKVPDGNVVWMEDKILRFSQIDLGIAVSVEGGLLTPVLRDVGQKSARDISEICTDLIARARYRKTRDLRSAR